MTHNPLRHTLLATALVASIGAAHAQNALTCPTPDAGPATELILATGDGWTFKEMNDTTWVDAYTNFQHPNCNNNPNCQHASWYNPAAAGNPGRWLTPDAMTTTPMFPTPTGSRFDFRSPEITIDPRVELSTITASFERTADNYFHDVGLSNSGTPAAGTFVGAPYIGGGMHSVLTGPTSLTLPWVADGTNRILLRISNAEQYATIVPDPDMTDDIRHGPMGVYTKVTLNATCRAQLSYTVTATAEVPAGGSITCTPANPVPEGSDVTCTAQANPGYVFTGFSGDCSGDTCDLTNLRADANVVAHFTLAPVQDVKPVPVNAPLALVALAGLLGFAAQRVRKARK